MSTWSEGGARCRAAVRGLSPRAILGLGFGAFLIYAYPGYMSNDSVLQLVEGRSGQRANPHPPVMAALWGVLDTIVSGPILMLVLQVGLFLGGLYVILCRVMPARPAAVTASALLLFPPIAATMGVIWKDSQMAAYGIAAVAALLDRRRAVRLAGLGLATAACAFRYNGFAAAVPLVGLLFVWTPGARWWTRYAIGGLAAVVAFGLAVATNRALTVKPAFLAPAFTDIVGVLAFTRERTDEDLREVLRDTPLRVTTGIQAKARQVFSARNPYGIDHGDGRMFDAPTTETQRAALVRAWRELVGSDLVAYLRFRWAGFREVLGLSAQPLWSPVWNDFLGGADQAGMVDHDATWSSLQYRLGRGLTWLAFETPLFRPYLYALLALLLLAVACRDRVTLALFVSGLLYELSFAVAGGTPDNRYSHWLIVCTCLATVMLFARRLGARPEVVA